MTFNKLGDDICLSKTMVENFQKADHLEINLTGKIYKNILYPDNIQAISIKTIFICDLGTFVFVGN